MGIFNKNKKEKFSGREYFLDFSPSEISLDIDSDEVEILEGNTFKVVTSNMLIKNDFRSGDGKTFKIRQDEGRNQLPTKTFVYFPENTELTKVVVTLRSGNITIKDLECKILEVNLHNGNVTLENVTSSNSSSVVIDLGNLYVKDGTFVNANACLMKGNIEATTNYFGENTFYDKQGDIGIRLKRSLKEYNISCEVENGHVGLDGMRGTTKLRNGRKDAAHTIDAFCQTGNCTVNYFEQFYNWSK